MNKLTPLEIIKMYNEEIKMPLSSGKHRSVIFKLLLAQLGTLSTDEAASALRYASLPNEISDSNMRQIFSRMRSNKEFTFVKKHGVEYISHNDMTFTNDPLFDENSELDRIIDCKHILKCAANAPSFEEVVNNSRAYHAYEIVSNLNPASSDNSISDVVVTFKYNDRTESMMGNIGGEYIPRVTLPAFVTSSNNNDHEVLSESDISSIDRLNVRYDFDHNDILLVPMHSIDTQDSIHLDESNDFIVDCVIRNYQTLLFLAKSAEATHPTLSDFVDYMYALSHQLGIPLRVGATPWYPLLKILQKNGEIPTSDIESVLKTIMEPIHTTVIDSLHKEITEEVLSQKKKTFEYFNAKYKPLAEDFCLADGVPDGQMIILESPLKFRRSFPYLYPGDLFCNKLPSVLENLGLKIWEKASLSTPWPPCPHSFDYLTSDGKARSFSLRNAFTINGFTIAVEQISSDIGGLLRTMHYVNRPAGSFPNTLLIAIVDDDYILADGQQLMLSKSLLNKDSSLFEEDPNSARYENVLEYLNSLGCWNVKNHKYLPLATSETHDIVFITFSQWEAAKYSRVYPWIYNFKNKEFILRGL